MIESPVPNPWVNRAILLTSLVMAGYVSHLFAKASLLLVGGVNAKPVAASHVASRVSSQSPKSQVDLDALVNSHLFGEQSLVVEEEPQPVDENIDAPKTSLDLVLQGVSVAPVEANSSAIVAAKKGAKGELFWIGDSVSSEVTLEAVFADRVVLKQNGRLEALYFSDEYQIASSGGNSSNGSRYNSSNNLSQSQIKHSDMLRSYRSRLNSKNETAQEIGSALNQMNRGNFNDIDNLLDKYGANLEGKIENAMKTAGIEEVATGMRINHKANTSWLSQAGLRRGDVVKSINDQSVVSLKSNRQAIDSVLKSCSAKIEVQRGQRTFVVNYPFCK